MQSKRTAVIAACILLALVAVTATATAATVTGISRSSGYQGDTITVSVYGSGFVAGTEVALMRTGAAIWTTGNTVVNSGTIKCTIPIGGAATGLYHVVVKLPGQTYWTGKGNAFTVLPGIRVTGISPNTVERGKTFTATVYGTSFLPGTEVALEMYGGKPVYYATGETYLSPTAVRCTLTVPANAPLGYYNVYIRHPVFRGGTNGWIYGRNLFKVVDPAPRTVEKEIFRLVNLERVKVKVPTLQWNEKLTLVARAHSDDMALKNFFDHTGSNQKTWSQRLNAAGFVNIAMAENIALRSGAATDNPTAVAQGFVNQWMASTKGHRETLLSRTYTRTGVGVAFDADRKVWLATQDFVS